jgi:hypothetical protein
MNQPITFFRPRQTDNGTTYSFDLESSNRRYRVFVYSRATVDDSLIRDRKTDDYSAEIRRLLQAISPGVLVVTYEEEGQRNYQVTPAGLSNAAFSICGLLRPGSPLSVEKIDQERFLRISLGAHLLIPVDREAEAHLLSLQDFLAWLPPDMEALILYAISKPSLEARISKLEAKEKDGEPGRGLGGWLKARFKRQVPIWPVALFLILLLLGLNTYLLYSLPRKIQALSKSSASQSPGAGPGVHPATGASGIQAKKTSVSAAEQRIFDAAQALQDQQNQDNDFKRLYDDHFSKLKEVGDVANNLKKKEDRELLMIGLMKLEALRLDRKAAAPLVAETADLRKLKDFYKGYLKDHPGAGDLLAVLGCEAYKVPGLPAQEFHEGASPVFKVKKKECAKLNLENAVPGLDQLISFVKNPNGAE